MRVLVVEDNALLRHHLKVQLQGWDIRSMRRKTQRKRITIWVNMFRTSPSSTLACRMKTAFR